MSDTNPLVNRFPWTGTVKVSGSAGGGGATGIAAITGGFIDNTAITNGSLTDAIVNDCTITGGSLDGAPVGLTNPASGTFTSLTVRLTSTFGASFANYATLAGANPAGAVTMDITGSDTSVDLRLTPKGRGLLSTPRALVGTHSAGSAIAAPRLFTVNADQTISAAGAAFRVGGILRGTVTGNMEGYYVHVLDEDRLAFSDPNQGATLNYTAATLRAGWSGGRVLHGTQLYVGNPASPGASAQGTAGGNAYHVAGASFAYSFTSAGGVTGSPKGNLFGRNDATRVRAGSGYHWNSTFGNETDVGVEDGSEVAWKGGIKIVQWATDKNRGVIQDYAFGMGVQAGGTAPGWRVGWSLGGVEGWWPFTADSRIIGKIDPSLGGGPALAAAMGADFTGISFGRSSFEASGFVVDGSGNLGATTSSGVALQTRSEIVAKTATVASVTVLEGGLYTGSITLTGTAPAGSGTTATFAVATVSIPYINSINTAGTDYAEGDTITLVGGTSSVVAVGVVTKVFLGGVQGIKMTTPGDYSVVPGSPVATTTSGAGTGLTLTPQVSILTVGVSGAGTNYSEFLPPTIASAGSLATYRQALLKVAMTATQQPLALNPAGQVLFPTQGAVAAAGTTQGAATLITSDFVNATAAALQLGVRLPPALVGMRKVVSSAAASGLNTLALYPATGESIFVFGSGDLGTNVAQSILAEKAFAMECTVAGRWYAYQIS